MIDRFTAKAREAVSIAVNVAETLGHNYVGTEHLLIGLLHEGSGVAAKVLAESGVREEKVMELVSQLLLLLASGHHASISAAVSFSQRLFAVDSRNCRNSCSKVQ